MLEVKIIEVSVTQMGFAIVLKPLTRNRVVPIFVGPLETYSISTALDGQVSERPLTHDLMKTILYNLGYRLEKVLVNNFKGGTFYARIFLDRVDSPGKNTMVEIDSRPSDAIALAVRFGTPIFMSDHVYDKVSVELDVLKEKKEEIDSASQNYDESMEDSDFLEEEGKDEFIQTILDEFSGHAEEYQKPEGRPASYQSKKEVLENMLARAISNEQYEEAAKLRDELIDLKVGKNKGYSSVADFFNSESSEDKTDKK